MYRLYSRSETRLAEPGQNAERHGREHRGQPVVGPLFLNVSSFDAGERVWYIAACPDDRPEGATEQYEREIQYARCGRVGDGSGCFGWGVHADTPRGCKERL